MSLNHKLRFGVGLLPNACWKEIIKRFKYIEELGFDITGTGDHFLDYSRRSIYPNDNVRLRFGLIELSEKRFVKFLSRDTSSASEEGYGMAQKTSNTTSLVYLAILLINSYVLLFSSIPFPYKIAIIAFSFILLVLLSLALQTMETRYGPCT